MSEDIEVTKNRRIQEALDYCEMGSDDFDEKYPSPSGVHTNCDVLATEVVRLRASNAALTLALADRRGVLIRLAEGCRNHGCRIKAPTGQATNGPCRCLDRLKAALAIIAPPQQEKP